MLQSEQTQYAIVYREIPTLPYSWLYNNMRHSGFGECNLLYMCIYVYVAHVQNLTLEWSQVWPTTSSYNY